MSYHSRFCKIPRASERNDFDPACTCGQAARNAAYLEKKAEAEPTPEQLAEGERLAFAGWCQVSRKYRRVVHVPDASDALAELARVAPIEAERVRQRAEEYAQREARAVLWHHGETLTLDVGTFEAFRRARLAAGEAYP